MRIGIYNPRVGTAESGGTETFLREMLKRLSSDHTITVYTGSGQLLDEINALDVSVKQIPFRRKDTSVATAIGNFTPLLPAEVESFSMYLNARRQGVFSAMASEVDVLSTHYYLDNLLVSRTTSVPTLFRFPGIRQPSIRWKVMARFAKPCLYLSNSQSTAERVSEWLDINVDGTVYAGVDTDQFSPTTEPEIHLEKPTILFVGRLDEGKGLMDLLAAHSKLHSRGQNAELVLVGEGTLYDKLQQEARRLNIFESVTFTGSVPHDEIHRYYAAADVFCLPSYHEGFPVVNMEAMATGLAIVSTNIDAVKEQLTANESGLLFEPGDVVTLTDQLDRALSDSSLRSRLGESARKRAEELTWETQADVLETYYERVQDISSHPDA